MVWGAGSRPVCSVRISHGATGGAITRTLRAASTWEFCQGGSGLRHSTGVRVIDGGCISRRPLGLFVTRASPHQEQNRIRWNQPKAQGFVKVAIFIFIKRSKFHYMQLHNYLRKMCFDKTHGRFPSFCWCWVGLCKGKSVAPEPVTPRNTALGTNTCDSRRPATTNWLWA